MKKVFILACDFMLYGWVKLFRMVKLAENAGFGFDKMDVNWNTYNATTLDYKIDFDSFIVDFNLATEDKLDDGLGDKLGDNKIKILSEI